MTTCVMLIRIICKDKYHESVGIMTDISEYMTCSYCGYVAHIKYHNCIIPYCGNCNRDEYGDKVYMCNSCGLSNPSNRMESEIRCEACWQSYSS